MKIHIREAHPTDAQALSDLALSAKSHWGYPEEWIRLWRNELTLTPDYLSLHQGFVAVSEDATVGMCVLELAGDKASIEHVWISPRCHRQGVGRALVNRALAAAARAGAAEVEVLSDPFAEMFYVKLGARRLDAVPAPMPGAPGRTVPRLAFVLPPRGHVEVDLRP